MLTIICPSCKTKYQDNKKSITMGDSVKCCVCKYNWIVSSRNAIHNEIDNNLKFNNIENKLENIRQKNKSFSNTSFIISSIVLLFVITILAKDNIAKTFPATQNIYYNLGLMEKQKTHNKVLLILTSNNQKNTEKNSMILKGIIHNKLNNILKNPTILVELLNNKGNLIENHQIKLDFDLAINKSEVFRIVIQNPTLGIASVQLKYIK